MAVIMTRPPPRFTYYDLPYCEPTLVRPLAAPQDPSPGPCPMPIHLSFDYQRCNPSHLALRERGALWQTRLPKHRPTPQGVALDLGGLSSRVLT